MHIVSHLCKDKILKNALGCSTEIEQNEKVEVESRRMRVLVAG